MTGPLIRVGAPQVDGSRVAVLIDSGRARRHLRQGWFLVDHGELDLSRVDPSILVIPALGTVLPIAYAIGATVVAPTVDRRYAQAARDLAPAWQRVYPRFCSASFALEAEERENHPGESGRAAMLYSGGLDSTATLIARRDEIGTLVTVWGADVPVDDSGLWHRLRAQLDGGPLAEGRRRITVRSNFRDFPVELTLVHDFLAAHDSWWARAHHGMGLIALTAPVTAARGNGTVLVPASYSPTHNEPNGSMPETDALHRWVDTVVEHEGFELSRQGKVDTRLAPYLRSGGSLTLAVCYQPGREVAGLNCGRCEKCLRTAAGLLAGGIEPAEVGLVIDDGTYRHWAGVLSGGHAVLHQRARPFWFEVRDVLGGGLPARATAAEREFLAAITDDRLDAAFAGADHAAGPAGELKYQLRRAVPERFHAPGERAVARVRAATSRMWRT